MSLHYESLVGHRDGARKLHLHRTVIPDTAAHPPYQHDHAAEEAFYLLEGRAIYRFGGKTIEAGPGDTVFIPSGVWHAEIDYLTPSMTYLTIRTVEPGDEPCCCGGDREEKAPIEQG
ncbi:MAG: cupin domain-containing protein [Verrucomicrobiae bacterium]|nr:cupin domain-containing protein [Verrucomicrobiae bacterium]